MKAKKLYKRNKGGEVWERGRLWDVKKLRKRMVEKRTCRFRKHKNKEEE